MRHPDNACAAGFPFVGGVALLTPHGRNPATDHIFP
ncbi:hypothetical protein FRC0088_00562 [Corynebacterium diphtheriae]|nr:hypothetical protein FRC0088_00562 [Corynebacterium diphtheriae]